MIFFIHLDTAISIEPNIFVHSTVNRASTILGGDLSKEQKKLLEQFAETESSKTSPEATGFFAKVKDLWTDL